MMDADTPIVRLTALRSRLTTWLYELGSIEGELTLPDQSLTPSALGMIAARDTLSHANRALVLALACVDSAIDHLKRKDP